MLGEIMNFSEYVYYSSDSPSGLRWKDDRCWVGGMGCNRIIRRKDKIAGSKCKNYWIISLGKNYYAHRVIYCLLFGLDYFDKTFEIDHIDGDCYNNSEENLRVVIKEINLQNKRKYRNNTSGENGIIYRTKKRGLYHYWAAVYYDTNGVKREKAFNIEIYGSDIAKQLAVEWRNNKINELNLEGMNYTTRHGK